MRTTDWAAQTIGVCGMTALRVTETCQRLGATAAVLAEAPCSAASILESGHPERAGDMAPETQAIIDAAKIARVNAIHPGIGVLARSARFADEVISAGLGWLSAAPTSIRLAEDRARLRAAAQRVGFRVTPNLAVSRPHDGGDGDRKVTVDFIGLPDARVALLGLRETTAALNDLAYVEETPPMSITQSLWQRVLECTASLVAHVGYVGVGHSVVRVGDRAIYLDSFAPTLSPGFATTEAATGVDLVELQLQLASDNLEAVVQELPSTVVTGHVFTMYIRPAAACASTDIGELAAQIVAVHESDLTVVPSSFRCAPRLDRSVEATLATVVAHGQNRAAAMRTAQSALRRFDSIAAHANVGDLERLLRQDAFWNVPVDTSILQKLRGE